MHIVLLPLLQAALFWCNICIAGDIIHAPLEMERPLPKDLFEDELEIAVQARLKEEDIVKVPPRRGSSKYHSKSRGHGIGSNYMEQMRKNRGRRQIVKGLSAGKIALSSGNLRRVGSSSGMGPIPVATSEPPDFRYTKMAAILDTISSAGDTVVTVFNSTTIYGLNTTIVNLRTGTNGTVTISSFTSPTSPFTPMPRAAYYILGEVAFDSYEYFVNASSYEMGALFPLTLEDVPYLAGVQYAEAFRCQLRILNSNRAILPNSYVAYTIRNSDHKIPLATGEAYEFDRKYYFMVVGPPYNDQVSSISYLYAPQNLSFVSYSASAVDIGNSTRCPSFFRTIPSDNVQARAMAETMRLFSWTFVAALFTNDAYGLSGFEAFITQAGRNRIKVTCANSFNPGSTEELQIFSSCVAASDASVVLLWSKAFGMHTVRSDPLSSPPL